MPSPSPIRSAPLTFASMSIAALFAGRALPCTVFCISDGATVLAGNNEDFVDPATRLWVVPGVQGERGRIYFGFADGSPQGGVNDAGL